MIILVLLILLSIQSFDCQLTSAINSAPIMKSNSYFEAILDHFDTVYENKKFMEWHLKVRRFNTTRKLIGYIEFKVPFGDDIKFEVKSLKKQGNEYRYLAYKSLSTGFCTLCSNDKYTYPDFAKNSDLPANLAKECPLQPGNYTFYGVTLELENVPKMIMPSGDYAGELIVRNIVNEVIGTYRMYVQINQI